MTIVKVAEGKYINLDRVTYIEPKRGGRLIVHFAVGGGDIGGPSCEIKLDEDEAAHLIRWLDRRAENL